MLFLENFEVLQLIFKYKFKFKWLLKANFKIKNGNSDKKETDIKDDEKISYEKKLESISKGWNLWSIRSSEKHL